MGYRTAVIATIALSLSAATLAAIVYTDAYSHAAQAEASGYHALTEQLGDGADMMASADQATGTTVRQ